VVAGRAGTNGVVLVVDDDVAESSELCAILERVGYATRRAASGEEALEAVRDQAPALVLLDVCLPGISGYQVCRELKDGFGEGLPVVFVSASRTDSYDRAAGLLIGGDDYLTKPVGPDELVIRVGRLIRRSTPLDRHVAAKLTKREHEVLRLLAEGLSPVEIAARLSVSRKTVLTHIDHILQKLGVHSRLEAVALAYRGALIETPS
jgi:two-component system, NarL family, nitrate/nitrite response regulator NarL